MHKATLTQKALDVTLMLRSPGYAVLSEMLVERKRSLMAQFLDVKDWPEVTMLQGRVSEIDEFVNALEAISKETQEITEE